MEFRRTRGDGLVGRCDRNQLQWRAQKIAPTVETTHVLFNNNYEDQGPRGLVR